VRRGRDCSLAHRLASPRPLPARPLPTSPLLEHPLPAHPLPARPRSPLPSSQRQPQRRLRRSPPVRVRLRLRQRVRRRVHRVHGLVRCWSHRLVHCQDRRRALRRVCCLDSDLARARSRHESRARCSRSRPGPSPSCSRSRMRSTPRRRQRPSARGGEITPSAPTNDPPHHAKLFRGARTSYASAGEPREGREGVVLFKRRSLHEV